MVLASGKSSPLNKNASIKITFLLEKARLFSGQNTSIMVAVKLPMTTVYAQLWIILTKLNADNGHGYQHVTLYDPFRDTSRRVSFDVTNTYIYGYPSKGGVIALANATMPDLDFLRFSRTHPPEIRFCDAKDENEFCKRLLRRARNGTTRWHD